MAKISFTSRFDEIDYAKMQKIAKLERRTMASLVQYFCALGLTEYEKTHGEVKITDEDLSID